MNVKIDFSVEDVEMPSLVPEVCADWLVEVAHTHGMEPLRLSYLFCSDEYILQANREFVQHDYYTDIITFDYSRHPMVSGDILISLDTVRSNAQLFGVSYERELARVIVHGLLHLCGIDDKGPGEREIMEAHEDAALEIMPDNMFENDI